jgi:hypothetical protein
MFYKSGAATSSFDNVAFLSKDHVTFVQDMGDGLHEQANLLDSAFVFDANADYSDPANKPVRWLAEGRDPSATLDASLAEGDNEITGTTGSDGDPGTDGILGAGIPNLSGSKWRFFWTQQHRDNNAWEVIPAGRHGNGDDNENG